MGHPLSIGHKKSLFLIHCNQKEAFFMPNHENTILLKYNLWR